MGVLRFEQGASNVSLSIPVLDSDDVEGRFPDVESCVFAGRGEDVKLSMESHHSQESVNFRLRISDDEILRILNIIRTSSADCDPRACLATEPQTDSEEE